MNDPGLSAAILAGGTASRLGGINKSNIIVDGKTVISRIMETLSCIFNEIIIVTNNPGEFSYFKDYKVIADTFKGIGPLGGIHAALEASSTGAVFVVAGDMPLLKGEIIMDQIGSFRNNLPDVLIPRIGDYLEPLHSVYKKTILEHLGNYIRTNQDKAVWKFINTTNVEFFEPEDEIMAINSFISINLPSDADLIEKIIRSRL